MKLKKLDRALTICKVATLEEAILDGQFLFVGKTDREISVVCETDHAPTSTLERSDGWMGFRIEGQLDFSLIGVLARISKVLAEASIGIFVLSTFDTDYVLVRATDFDRAVGALTTESYTFID